MLPFLAKPKSQGAIVTEYRKPDEGSHEDDADAGLKACAKDLIEAVESKDLKKAADAIRAAFQILDAEPHEEGPHLDDQE